MIERLNKNKSYNPVRSHIQVGFISVKDYPEKINFIVEDLIKNRFDEKKSRVLIFVSKRNMAETAVTELSQVLSEKNLPYSDKVDYYHAGLLGSEREEKFNNYKKGKILILIATKAFGMGMDIPNVHFVYHLEPSSNFEDFLQEVGRAGRNEKANLEAGFSEKNPIKTTCIIAKDDFKILKEKLHKKEMTWNNIIQVQKTVYDYVNNYAKKELSSEDAFALPTDLLDQYIEYKEYKNDETFFRVILYWLEKLKKIKLGTYTPTHIPISISAEKQNYSVINDSEDVDKIKYLHSKLRDTQRDLKDDNGYIMVKMEQLKDNLKADTFRDIWRVLFLAQKAGIIKIEREIIIEPTKSRTNELEKWSAFSNSPVIESVFAFAKKIMNVSKYNQQTHFEEEELNSIGNEAIEEHIQPNHIYWKEFTKKGNEISTENISLHQIEDFKKKRSKQAFKLINFLPEGKHKSILQTEVGYKNAKVTQLIYNGYKSSKDWNHYLDNFKKDLYDIIKFIYAEKINSDNTKFNIVDLLLKLKIENKGEEYFNQLIFIAKGLGFLNGNSSGLIPMGIELFINDKNILDDESLNQFEQSIKVEFEESNRMKLLRLLALECISDSELVRVNQYDTFIKSYFRCASETDFTKLFEEYFGENHESLEAFRSEALKKAIKSLNDDQKKVYNASIKENLQVIAGPGSGKTHTLILRVARLIQDENINPENILVLAYNRAVVVELKDRLNKLFRKLGYAKIIKRLNVFTFHGFCKYILDRELDGLNFDQWTTQFLRVTRESPGKISQKLGLIKYVFVDEFQDITKERLDLLEFIAKPTQTKICVIGDPNQSIYGFDRVKEGGEMSPLPYYDSFSKIYNPKELYLSQNRRSYQQVIDKADELLSLNTSRFNKMPKMKAFHGKGKEPVCEFYDLNHHKTDWKLKLKELTDYINEDGKHFQNIALMFRSNIEVYRAFNEIKKLKLSNVRIRIQGASGSLSRTREFHYFLNQIKNKGGEKLSIDFFEKIKQMKQPLLIELPNWDEYLIDVFLCIAHEFKKEIDEDSTFEDLFDFILDISNKDDGQYGKIYSINIHHVNDSGNKIEIILTTMHKVKGIEYDAVLIPSSLSNFGLNHDGEIVPNLNELYEEERRLYYVAYTRAKYKLVVIKWKKENSLYNTNPEPIEIFKAEEVKEKLGILMEEGIDKFTLYWGASQFGRTSYEIIRSRVRLGDEVALKKRLQKNPNGADFYVWEVFVNENIVAQLSSNVTNRLDGINSLNGFIVSSIYVHTYEETEKSDIDWTARGRPVNERGRPFSSKWIDESKSRGYIYVIDFSGYGKKLS
jgi:ATP-dependent DNA helicase RecQ